MADMDSKVQQAVSCFGDRYNCAQAILSTYAPQYGLDRETALRVAGAFGGGIARMAETCGAVTGAIMLTGLRCASTRSDDIAARENTYAQASLLVQQFRAAHGSISCRELLGCDISTPEGQQEARARGLFTTLCPRLVQTAAELVEHSVAGQ